MKSSTALVALFVAFVPLAVGLKTEELARALWRVDDEDCRQLEGASDADVNGIVNDVGPETRTQKCLVACMQEQKGVSNGRSFQPFGFLAFWKSMGNEVGIAHKIITDCGHVSDSDRCELAVKIVECIVESASNRM